MNELKLLIVEDSDTDLSTCRDCVGDFNNENECKINLIECRNLKDALEKLNKTFDGAIIDIKLDTQGTGDEGIGVLEKIQELYSRIPIAVLTGTPGSVEQKPNYVGVFIKGEAGSGYNDIINLFWEIYNTGLTRIIGGRGKIEESLERIFNENLMLKQYRKKWIEYGKIDSSRTENALLRYIVGHLLQLLDDNNLYFPEEFYLAPPFTNEVKTGSIVKQSDNEQLFVVLTPACDIIIRNGSFKTDRILLVEIEGYASLINYALNEITDEQEKKIKLRQVLVNNFTNYYHWLPKTDFFQGGFLNFRKLLSLKPKEFKARFNLLGMQIHPSFIKDIIGRFASYYSRQGQPDIEVTNIVEQLLIQHR